MMPDITVRGGSAKKRGLVFEAAEFYLERLLPDCYQEITLIIRLRRNAADKGTCIWEDDVDEPREFEIELDADLNIAGTLRCLAHEMVHVKQYVTKEMKDTSQGSTIVRWYRKKYDMALINYHELPWEIEAYGKEHGLYDAFVKKFHYTKKKWYRDPDYL